MPASRAPAAVERADRPYAQDKLLLVRRMRPHMAGDEARLRQPCPLALRLSLCASGPYPGGMDSGNLAAFEREAEVLVAHQLDLIAQLERQLRAIHRTMRQIEKLRNAKNRPGSELTNGEKVKTLSLLTDELAAIDGDLGTQHESCVEMHVTIDHMRARLRAFQQPADTSESETPHSGQPQA